MLACISPWVRNKARILRIKALRIINLPGRMGCIALLSATINTARLMTAAAITARNAFDVQPKFCPKEGIQSIRLKNMTTSAAPKPSKF